MNNTKTFIDSVPSTDIKSTLHILHQLLVGAGKSSVLQPWNDTLRGHDTAVDFTLVMRDPSLLRQLVMACNPLLLAGAYSRGVLDIKGDLYGTLRLKNHFESIQLSQRDELALLKDALMLSVPGLGEIKPGAGFASRVARRLTHRHSHHNDHATISFHYDVSNKFYGLWLDEGRVYSCACFGQPSGSLDTAQCNRLEHVCRELRLRPGERLLDIDCGWGAFVCWAAREHGIYAHGITLSERQPRYAREHIRIGGLQDRVTVKLRDYRDLEGESVYDKVSSIEMFEHVGLCDLPACYAVVRRVLRPGGLFLNHDIMHDEEGQNKTAAAEFINHYIFPDGELDCINNIQLGMEHAGFEIHDVERLRPHYTMTLRHWVHRLEARRDATIAEVREAAYRVQRLYMTTCALGSEAGGSGIYQILASNRHPGK